MRAARRRRGSHAFGWGWGDGGGGEPEPPRRLRLHKVPQGVAHLRTRAERIREAGRRELREHGQRARERLAAALDEALPQRRHRPHLPPRPRGFSVAVRFCVLPRSPTTHLTCCKIRPKKAKERDLLGDEALEEAHRKVGERRRELEAEQHGAHVELRERRLVEQLLQHHRKQLRRKHLQQGAPRCQRRGGGSGGGLRVRAASAGTAGCGVGATGCVG